MDVVANLVRAQRRRLHGNVRDPGLGEQVLHDKLSHRAAAYVPMAYKKYLT